MRFRRFAHKAYAAFASMHHEVTLGRVSRAICDLEMLKAGRTATLCGVALVSSYAMADESVSGLTAEEMAQQLSIQEVLVQATKTDNTARSYRLVATVEASDLQTLPATSVADILRYLPGLDVRTRGINGAQADVGLRGGTFDQVRVLLNGVDLSDAHTGHYALNLPISMDLIERIEVLDGAINVITRTASTEKPTAIQGRLTAGSSGLVNPEFSVLAKRGDWSYVASAEYLRSNGYYVPNPSEKEQIAAENSDARIANAFFRASHAHKNDHGSITVGGQYKDAGAGMYYGFGSQTQRDQTGTAFLAWDHSHRWGAWSLNAKAAYRANADYYQWWRTEPVKGANRHLSQRAWAELHAAYVSSLGTTTFGIEGRYDHIYSTNLGDSASHPLHWADRDLALTSNRGDVLAFAQQTFHYKQLNASVRAEGHYNTRFGGYFNGHANLGWDYTQNGTAFIHISHTNRMPTFTDLYYKAGQQRGSRSLKAEAMTTFTLGTRYTCYLPEVAHSNQHSLELDGSAFYRIGTNIIDWNLDISDSLYHATNQNRVDAAGCEVNVTYRLNKWLPCVRLTYAYTWLDLDLNATNSRYLDYLNHKLTAHVEHAIWVFPHSTLGAAWTLTYQSRKGQYDTPDQLCCDFKPVLLLDGQIYWSNSLLRVCADLVNMTNRHYYDYGGILQPGIHANATVAFKL